MPLAGLEEQRLGEPCDVQALVSTLASNTDLFGLSDPRTIAAAHELAIGLWRAGSIDGAIVLLDQALDLITSDSGCDDPLRTDVLDTLGEITLEQGHVTQACTIFREVLEFRIRQAGGGHPKTLAAKGNLARKPDQQRISILARQAIELERSARMLSHPRNL